MSSVSAGTLCNLRGISQMRTSSVTRLSLLLALSPVVRGASRSVSPPTIPLVSVVESRHVDKTHRAPLGPQPFPGLIHRVSLSDPHFTRLPFCGSLPMPPSGVGCRAPVACTWLVPSPPFRSAVHPDADPRLSLPTCYGMCRRLLGATVRPGRYILASSRLFASIPVCFAFLARPNEPSSPIRQLTPASLRLFASWHDCGSSCRALRHPRSPCRPPT